MSTTIYDVADLTNIQRTGSIANITDSGTGVNADMSGSDTATANGTSDTSISAFCSASDYEITADVDHSSPINPIPSNAQITNVIIRFTAEVTAACDASCTAGAGGPASLASLILISILPQSTTDDWSTIASVDVNTNNTANVPGNNSDSVSNSYPLTGTLVSATYDFTTNPNGDFPSGYMSYADFIAFFASIALKFDITILGNANNGSVILASGDVNSSITITTTQWEMEVTWQQSIFSNWITLGPTNLDVTDPTFKIDTLADEEIPPAPDGTKLTAGNITKLIFNSPNSPCVVTLADPVVDYWWVKLLNSTTEEVHRIQIRVVMCALQVSETVSVYAEIVNAVIPDGNTGTQFSGIVLLGILTINYADLSGLYTLDDDAHSDELYDRTDTTAITTIEVAIPAPMFVSSFVGNDEVDLVHYNGTRMRVTGRGTFHQFLQSLDNINVYQMPDLTLLGANNINPYIPANFIDQEASLRVYLEPAVDSYFNVSQFSIFATPLFVDYPQ